jgi:hypothetical protein
LEKGRIQERYSTWEEIPAFLSTTDLNVFAKYLDIQLVSSIETADSAMTRDTKN